MLLKSIKLHNIRSYEDAEISLPSGSVLLAGDIGSGKSTILLAIEFAIFGAKKGELPAYTILRHGKKEGFVELKMNIEGKEIMIKRTLKRSNDDIKQEAGYLIVNGMKKDATSEELRALSLDLLGYPKDLVKKGKDLIYRYTVYTPQEEMKQILYESKDARLDTLRKVFNIDKYKRIKDNSGIVVKALREKKRHLEGYVLDFEYKKKQLEERKNEIGGINKRRTSEHYFACTIIKNHSPYLLHFRVARIHCYLQTRSINFCNSHTVSTTCITFSYVTASAHSVYNTICIISCNCKSGSGIHPLKNSRTIIFYFLIRR